MRLPYPKTPQEITLHESQWSITGLPSRERSTVCEITLGDKLNQYVSIGFSNSHVLGVVLQLMTQGKIRVEFRDYVERLELTDPADALSRQQGVTLFDDFMKVIAARNAINARKVTKKIGLKPSEAE